MPPVKTGYQSRNPVGEETRGITEKSARTDLGSIVLFSALCLIELWVSWWAIRNLGGVINSSWQQGFILCGLHFGLASALIKTLFGTHLTRGWSYRSGLLASLGLPLLSLPSSEIPGVLLVFAWTGAILGALALTGWQEGLWEDNLPPPKSIKNDVHEWHTARIGIPRGLPLSKRLFDLALASISLLVTSPLCLMITLLIWLDDPGPFLFVKNSVGRGGKSFHQFKFRTLIRDAERTTGPILTGYEDARVLWIGRVLRKTALDELPQLLNILRGEMSFVGPRPQRTVLVHGYLQTIPDYAKRHQVPPGLSGLAQVVGSYFMEPQEKLYWDRQYIEHMSLLYDLKLIVMAFLVVFWLRWQKDWDERLPVRLMQTLKR
jgi:lipopolysaccharide/colanic/teichoic acid biosynthesis glycosyltransferase